MTNACVCYALLITITTTVVLATPELPRVEDVGAGLLRPSEVIVYWTHVSSSYGTAKYTVHYAPSTTDGETVQKSVASDTNFAIIDLEVGPEYTFQVSGSFVVNSSIMEGPLSVVTRDSRVQTVETAQSFTMKDIATIVFGMLLFVSISINVLLLLVNIVLLRHFRKSLQLVKKVNSMSDISSQKSPSSIRSKGEEFVVSTGKSLQPTRTSPSSHMSVGGLVAIGEEDESQHIASCSSGEVSVEVEVEEQHNNTS